MGRGRRRAGSVRTRRSPLPGSELGRGRGGCVASPDPPKATPHTSRRGAPCRRAGAEDASLDGWERCRSTGEPQGDEMTGEQNVIREDGQGMPRIVAGAHGTPASDAALDWAVREARLRRAQLHLVLARDPTVSRRAPYAHPAAPGPCDADAAWLARAAVRAARTLPQSRVFTELADGMPARVLADRAAGASLLVLGSAPAGFLGPVPAPACGRRRARWSSSSRTPGLLQPHVRALRQSGQSSEDASCPVVLAAGIPPQGDLAGDQTSPMGRNWPGSPSVGDSNSP